VTNEQVDMLMGALIGMEARERERAERLLVICEKLVAFLESGKKKEE